jgi:hypothetical protein
MYTIHNTDISFNGNGISSYAGWVSVLSFLEQTGIWKLCNSRISEPWTTGVIWRPATYMTGDIIYSLIRWFALWAKHISDISQLAHAPVAQLSDRHIPSQSTLSKKITSFNWSTALQIRNIHNRICDQYFAFATKTSKLACLDISDDSSSIETFGAQEWSEYIHHYRINGFHPDFTTDDETRLILMGAFRDGNVYSSKGSELLISETLRRYWKYADVVKFRADSAYGKWVILDELHKYVWQWHALEAYVKAKTYQWWLTNSTERVEHKGKVVYHARKGYIRLSKVFLFKEWYNIALERLRHLNLSLA